MIPMNDVVKVYRGGNKDSWGIALPEENSSEHAALITYTTQLETMKTAEGVTVTVTANISFKGKVDIAVGDELALEDFPQKKFKVLSVQPIKDLGGKQLFTKAVI